jgi:hypothetical protein
MAPRAGEFGAARLQIAASFELRKQKQLFIDSAV